MYKEKSIHDLLRLQKFAHETQSAAEECLVESKWNSSHISCPHSIYIYIRSKKCVHVYPLYGLECSTTCKSSSINSYKLFYAYNRYLNQLSATPAPSFVYLGVHKIKLKAMCVIYSTQSDYPRVAHIFKSCLFFHSKLFIPLCYIRRDKPQKIRSIGGGWGVLQALQNIRPKYKGNGHNIRHKFLLAITFYEMHLSI